jgi:hypothetical protein
MTPLRQKMMDAMKVRGFSERNRPFQAVILLPMDNRYRWSSVNEQ